MQYDKYEQKVERIARFRKLIFRHMKKIIISAALLVATGITLLATRGIISTDECPAEIVYGDELDYSASAVLSDTFLEYRKPGEDEWSKETPTTVGTYEVRAAAKSTFGYRYGDVEVYEIKPKKIDIVMTSGDVVYGDDPALTSSDLQYGDRIVCDSFDYAEDRTSAEPHKSAIKIFNEKGEDVTGCYSFTTKREHIRTSKRQITVDVASGTKVYDGVALELKEYSISSGSVARGEQLIVDFDDSIISVGEIINSPEIKIVNKHGIDVTKYYTVIKNDGRLSVTKRPLVLESGSTSLYYDGKTHTEPTLTYKGEYKIIDRHTLKPTNWASITAFGQKNNTVNIDIVDENGFSALSNYEIEFIPGTIEVLRRQITINTGTEAFTYDAIFHTKEEYSIGGDGIAEKQEIIISAWSEIIDVGSTENKIEFYINDANGKDVTENYEISYNWGSLTVSKANLNVTTPTEERMYSGEEWGSFDLLGLTLADGDSVLVSEFATVKNVGAVENVVLFTIYNEQRGVEVTENYDITVTYGQLSVTKRNITVKTATDSWVYDNEEHSNVILELSGDGIAPFDTYTVDEFTTVKEVIESKENKIVISILNGEENATDNYNVEYIYGFLTVTKRPITVYTESVSKIYDGEALSSKNVTVDNMLSVHKIEIKSTSSITNAGFVENAVYEYDIVDSENSSVLSCYEVTFVNGTLTVDKRIVFITTDSAEKIYDTTPLTAPGWSVKTDSPYGLVSGHTILAPTPEGLQTEAGISDNVYSGEAVYIKFGEDDVTGNYDITISIGILTVHKRPVTVVGGGYEGIYDAKEHFDNTLTVSLEDGGMELCEGHVLGVTDYLTRTDVCNLENIIGFNILEGERIVDHNYDITFIPGKLVINPRPITVIGGGYEGIYDGKEHSNATLELSFEDGGMELCEGHEFFVIDCPKHKDVVTDAENRVEFTIVDENGDSYVYNNYAVTYVPGKVNIKPRPITVIGGGYEGVYDGKEHSNASLELSFEDGGMELCEGHEFFVIDYPKHKDVVTDAENRVDFTIVDENGESSVYSNYEVTYVPGKITIKPRPITVIGGGYEGIYDANEHYNTDLELSFEDGGMELCEGHEFFVIDYPKHKNVVTDAENRVDFTIVDENGESSVYSNYEVTYVPGKITIKPRPITVIGGGYEGVYDGMYHSNPNLELSFEDGGMELCEGHELIVRGFKNYKDVVTNVDNEVNFTIVDENGDDSVYENYDVTYIPGKINISPRKISIYTVGYDAVYDGLDHTDYDFRFNTGEGLYELCGGHLFEITSYKTFKGVVTNEENSVEFRISDENGVDVTENYSIETTFGIFTIHPRVVIIKTLGREWQYDGEEHKYAKYELMNGTSFVEWHQIRIVDSTAITDIGELDNKLTFKVLDEMEDVSENYVIETAEFGKLRVVKRDISITSQSKEKVYDGEPLVHHVLEILKDSSKNTLLKGHELIADFSGTITEVGFAANTYDPLTVKVMSGEEDVTHLYNISEFATGTLIIYDSSEPGEGPGEEPGEEPEPGENDDSDESGILSPSGSIGLPENYDYDEAQKKIAYVISSNRTGSVYLRVGSAGRYTGKAWEAAEEYDELILDYASAYYLMAYAINNGGGSNNEINIKSLNGQYVLPYFSYDGGADVIQTSDVYVKGTADDPYTIYYFTDTSVAELPPELLEYEAKYASFVRSQYLEIDDDTKEFMLSVAADNGLDPSDPDIIAAVASYIQGAATYSFEYNRALDSSSNIAIAFLLQYKEGVCQHYATAATLMYRALGIPARYTSGYSAHTVEGQYVEVTMAQAHAWVEVYVDGFGWIPVEVTGSGFGDTPDMPGDSGSSGGNSGENPGEEPDKEPVSITIQPTYQSKMYDGKPLYAKDEIDESHIQEYLDAGYTYEVKVSGFVEDFGVAESVVESFVFYDPYGIDVTDTFNVVYETNTLRIYEGVIKIYLYEKRYEYNGTFISYSKNDYIVTSIVEGAELIINNVNISMKDVGIITSDDINADISSYIDYSVFVDGSSEDQSHRFALEVADYVSGGSYTPFEITTRKITVTTSSASKKYDGKPLTSPSFYLSKGSLVEGHTIILKVTGSAISTSCPNTAKISSFDVVDEKGVSVKKNYKETIELGFLTID